MEWLDVHTVRSLRPGDFIKHKGSDNIYLVTVNYGDHVTAVKTVYVTNSSEWQVFREMPPYKVDLNIEDR